MMPSIHVTPEGLRQALRVVAAVIYIVLQLLVLLDRLTSPPER